MQTIPDKVSPGGTATVADWQALAASLYVICGVYDVPEHVLDALLLAAEGAPFAHLIEDLLPVSSPGGDLAA